MPHVIFSPDRLPEVTDFIKAKGFHTGSTSGIVNHYPDTGKLGVYLSDDDADPQYLINLPLFGIRLIRLQSDRVHLCNIYNINSKTWNVTYYGRSNEETTRDLARQLAEKFKVDIYVNLGNYNPEYAISGD